ncbi:hypothetical protein ACFSLT_21150 [Novosphingobium resinovorum]
MGFERAIAGLDAVLAPSAPGIAPLGRSPGNPGSTSPGLCCMRLSSTFHWRQARAECPSASRWWHRAMTIGA